jgi:hypothetical protein
MEKSKKDEVRDSSYPLADSPEPTPNNGDKKSVDQKISDIENNPRLNRRIERRYDRYEERKDKAKGDSEKLKKIEKKYGYNYDAAIKSGATADETGHWGSIDPSTGMILKGPKHPSIMKTRKIERVLGNKIIKKDGERYSVPRKKNK